MKSLYSLLLFCVTLNLMLSYPLCKNIITVRLFILLFNTRENYKNNYLTKYYLFGGVFQTTSDAEDATHVSVFPHTNATS